MDEKQLQLLWESHAKSGGFKDYNEFKSLMNNPNSRKVYFDDANSKLGFKDYGEFETILQVSPSIEKKNQVGSGQEPSTFSNGKLQSPSVYGVQQSGLSVNPNEVSQKPDDNNFPSTSTSKLTSTDARVGGEDMSENAPVINSLKTLGKAATLGLSSSVSGTLKSIGIAAKELDWFNEYKDKKATDLATYKAGEWVDKITKDLVGELSPEEQGRFAVQLAQTGGQMLGMMGGGVGAKAIKMSPVLTTAAIGAATGASSEWENAVASGATPEEAAKVFWINGAINSTDALPMVVVFRKLDKYTGGLATGALAKKLASTTGGRLANDVAQGFFTEALQEGFQQTMTNLTAKETYDATRDIFDDVGRSMALGGTVGATLTGIVSAIREKRTAGNLTKEEDEQLAKAEDFAVSKLQEAEDKKPKIEKAVDEGKITGIYADLVKQGQGEEVLKDIAQQAQNIGQDGTKIPDGNDAIVKQATIDQFGEDVVNEAIQKYPAQEKVTTEAVVEEPTEETKSPPSTPSKEVADESGVSEPLKDVEGRLFEKGDLKDESKQISDDLWGVKYGKNLGYHNDSTTMESANPEDIAKIKAAYKPLIDKIRQESGKDNITLYRSQEVFPMKSGRTGKFLSFTTDKEIAKQWKKGRIEKPILRFLAQFDVPFDNIVSVKTELGQKEFIVENSGDVKKYMDAEFNRKKKELNAIGLDENSTNKEIHESIKSGKIKEAIDNNKISYDDAVEIIESAGFEVPKDIQQSSTPQAKEPSTKPSGIEGETKVEKKTSAARRAKKLYKDIGEVDQPSDARGLALEYLAGGGKVSEKSINEVAGTAKRASLNTGAKEKKSGEVKSRDYVSKDGKSIDEIAHQIWDNLPDELKSSISTQDLKNELNDVVSGHNTRLSAATEFSDRYIVKEVKDALTEAEAKEVDDIMIQQRAKQVDGLPEEQQQELIQLLEKYQDKNGFIDWEKLEEDSNGFSPDILSLSEQTQKSLDAIIEKNISEGQSKPNDIADKDGISEKEIPKEKVETEVGKPPTVPPTKEKVVIHSERPATELSFRGLQNVANEFGYEDVSSRDPVTDVQEMQNARQTVDEWAEKGEYQKNIDELLEKINKKELVPTAKQRLILQQYLANESQKLRSIEDRDSKEYKEQFSKVKEIKRIGQIARQEAGAALRIGDTRSHPVRDIVDATLTMEEAQGGEPLTEKQSDEVEKLVNDYEEKLKVAEQKVADMEAKYAELEAKKKIDATKKSVGKKKSTDEYKKERDSIRESIKDKWKKAGEGDVLTAVPIPYAKQLVAIAPDVAKLMKSYIEEGITDFGEIIKKLHSEVQDVEPEVTEQDVSDIIAGKYDKPKETKADLERKLKNISNKKSEEAVKIRARIKSGQFDKVARPTSWVDNPEMKSKYPQAYKQAIDALDAKEQAQLDFDIAVYKAERAKRSKATKGIDLARAILATTKAVKSGIDDSAIMMQNIVAMMSHPRSAVKAIKEHALDALSEKRFRRYLTELHNSPMWELIEQSGLDITDPKSLKEQNKEEIFDNNLLNKDFKIKGKKYNVGKYLTRPFERAFTSLGNAMRVNMFTHIAGRWLEEGRTFEKNEADFKSLAALLNTQTGRGKLHTQIERASQLVTAGIWSPRLMASRLNMLGLSEVGRLWGAKGFYQGLTPEMRKMAIGDMTKFIGAGVALMALAGAAGADIDDDPESPTFGTIKIGNKKYNAWGGFTPYVKTVYQGITGKRKIGNEYKPVTKGKLIGSFMRSRLTPAAGVTTNILTGKDFSGKPITPLGEVSNLVLPLSIGGVVEGVEKDGAAGLLLQGLPSFVGIGVSDERDFENKNTFKVYEKKGTKVREATVDEVKKVNEEKEKIYQEELKKAQSNKGWGFNKYGELTTDDDAIKKKGVYDSLSQENKEELQSRLKTSATYQAKKKIKF